MSRQTAASRRDSRRDRPSLAKMNRAPDRRSSSTSGLKPFLLEKRNCLPECPLTYLVSSACFVRVLTIPRSMRAHSLPLTLHSQPAFGWSRTRARSLHASGEADRGKHDLEAKVSPGTPEFVAEPRRARVGGNGVGRAANVLRSLASCGLGKAGLSGTVIRR
jgi:hypothetical protein